MSVHIVYHRNMKNLAPANPVVNWEMYHTQKSARIEVRISLAQRERIDALRARTKRERGIDESFSAVVRALLELGLNEV